MGLGGFSCDCGWLVWVGWVGIDFLVLVGCCFYGILGLGLLIRLQVSGGFAVGLVVWWLPAAICFGL